MGEDFCLYINKNSRQLLFTLSHVRHIETRVTQHTCVALEQCARHPCTHRVHPIISGMWALGTLLNACKG